MALNPNTKQLNFGSLRFKKSKIQKNNDNIIENVNANYDKNVLIYDVKNNLNNMINNDVHKFFTLMKLKYKK